MLVLIQIVGWLACGILAVLAFLIGYSNLFRDEKGNQPLPISGFAFIVFLAAFVGALAVWGTGDQIRKQMDRAETDQLIEDLMRSAKGY